MYSEHPRGLELNSLLSVISALNINYYFAEINSSTNLMIQEFSQEFSQFGNLINVIRLADENCIREKIQNSVIQVINQTKFRTKKSASNMPIFKTIKNRLINPSLPNWNDLTLFKKYTVEYYTVSYLNSLSDIKERNALVFEHDVISRDIWIYDTPFSKGMLRFAYPAVLNVNDNRSRKEDEAILLNCVIKESINLDPRYNTKKYHEESLEIQVISNYLAFKFEQIYKNKRTRLRFLDVDLIRVKETGVYYCIEEFVEGVFKKWSNNEGFVNENEYTNLLNAFSHWTWTWTNEYLIVTDLQGFLYKTNEYILTDPALLCQEDEDRFGATNLGSSGIRNFFSSHQCNRICKELKLKRNIYQILPDKI